MDSSHGRATALAQFDELRRLHEGVLARYGLRPSQFAAWKATLRRGLGEA